MSEGVDKVDMRMLKDCNLDQEQLRQVIAIAVFGSYHEACFHKEHSDIDIMILLEKGGDWTEECDIEEYLESVLPDYFQHSKMHYTFINDLNYPFSELMLMSQDKIILEEEMYLDYRLAYACFKRDREDLEIIREENLRLLEESKNGVL